MITEQVYIFLCSVLVGAIMGIVFDFFRALRRNRNTRNVIVYIQDIVFWLIVGVIIITSSFILNNGELRAYMLIAYILGAIIYMLVLSNYVRSIFAFIFDTFEKFIKLIYKPINKFLEKLNKKQENLENRQEI